MTRLDWERNAIIPACGGTGVIGGRPFAAHFVQAVTFAGSVIIPTLDELSGVEVGAAIAFIVDWLTIEHQRTAHSVDIWQAIKGHHVSNDGAHHIRDRRAARYFDNGFVGDDFVDRRCLRRIGSRGLHAAPGRAGSPGDNRAGSGSGTFEFLNKRSTAADTEHPLLAQRRVNTVAHATRQLRQLHGFQRLPDAFFGDIPPQRHVGEEGIRQHHRILLHHCHALAQRAVT